MGKSAIVAAAVCLALAACSGGSGSDKPGDATGQSSAPSQTKANGASGPLFSECGGVNDQTMMQLTRVSGLVGTARNSVGCVWLRAGSIAGPHFSFTWYRGSPIGRERATEVRTRPSVEDINIGGYDGFIAMGGYPGMVNSLCEVGIGFGNDFIEWSISYELSIDGSGKQTSNFPDPCDVAKQLADMSIKAAKK